MHAGDGVAHLLGLADQGVALMRESLEQAADADFVVVVGALERGHLVGDQSLELGGARKRALDAVAHRGDLAADGLADGDDRFAGDLFGLRKLHGDARHRLRDDAQLLGAPHHVRHQVEEDHRREQERREPDDGRNAGRALTQRRLQLGQEQEGEDRAADHPGEPENGRDHIRGLGGAALQRLENLADRLPVVVGGAGARTRIVGVRAVEQLLLDGGGSRSFAPLPAAGLARWCGGWLQRRLGAAGGLIRGAQNLLDRGQRLIRRVLDLLRIVRHRP